MQQSAAMRKMLCASLAWTLAVLCVVLSRHSTQGRQSGASPGQDFVRGAAAVRSTRNATAVADNSALRRTAVPSVFVCALSKSQPAWRDTASTPIMRLLVQSVSTTTRAQQASHTVALLIGVDNTDVFWQQHGAAARAIARTEHGLDLRVVSYPRTKDGVLPFNALMREAFTLRADYLVRVNDDTEFKTAGWIPLGVAQLAAFSPPNVGVVGPTCHQGNTDIMTHDMVHRTHLRIFDTYYPAVFHNWYVDDWISTVYGPARTRKLASWVVHHHVQLGTRYTPATRDSAQLRPAVAAGAALIEAFVHKAPPWVVVVTASAGFDDMFRNWLRWFQDLRVDLQVVVIAEDRTTYDKYHGVRGLDVHLPVNESGHASALSYDSVHYKHMVSRRARHLLRLIDAHPRLIYTDIDTVWLRDPRPHFKGEYELWAQLDAPDYVCTGFMALRKTNATLRLLAQWDAALLHTKQLNQPVFNRILHASPVKYLGLSSVHFPSGKVLWADFARRLPAAVVVHNNYIIGKPLKIARFQHSKLWSPLPPDLSPRGPAPAQNATTQRSAAAEPPPSASV